MIPLTPAFLVAAAHAFVGVREQGGNNRGQMVEMFLREVKLQPGQPWCAAFVYHVGYWSHYDARVEHSSWPLPATGSCWELGDFAERKGLLVEEDKAPAEGDVFLLYNDAKKRFAHTGIVVAVHEKLTFTDGDWVWSCTTIEGNTSVEGSREGTATLEKVRWISPRKGDRFIRWVDFEKRETKAA